MPYTSYRRRGGYRRPYRRYTSSRPSYKATRKIVRQEIRKDDRKDHPLQWTDILFDGGNVNTTPTVHSLVKAVLDQEVANGAVDEWPSHTKSFPLGDNSRQCKYRISYIHYQLRFQQDAEAIETSNTFRTLMYSYINTWAENQYGLLTGGDIDQPPHTEYVRSMYFDRMRTLRGTQLEAESVAPGTAIIKGNKRCNSVFNFIAVPSESYHGWEENDIRWEAQSDTIGAGLQLYGFIRIYYRREQ